MPATASTAVKRVVVADDTAFVRDRFKAALESAGYRAGTVSSASELLALIRAERTQVDLVVIDLRLPQSHGVDLVRALRGVPGFHAPLVVFSGTIANAGEVRELAALGVAGYVNEYAGTQHIVPALAPHLFPSHDNRRSSPRVALGISVAYRFGNTIAAAVTLNVSHGGLAIRTTSPLDPATMVKIRFRLPGNRKEIDAEARVCWTDRRLGMGLQFTRIEPGDQAAVDEFVEGHFFSNRKA
jgi:two-component system chemotaxis response regulator CheY